MERKIDLKHSHAHNCSVMARQRTHESRGSLANQRRCAACEWAEPLWVFPGRMRSTMWRGQAVSWPRALFIIICPCARRTESHRDALLCAVWGANVCTCVVRDGVF
ncbi:hypothetical protein PoB_006900900 [Plakobranchus ocellatus]|uniref:Uncharacterized protein n=1 Tax=Plakobranchus ocellatus TaxID=259542 RepID=A0AAV4DE83_9GAST|nr:hypothetical protein PoB_006900900 [Plakobranchus ocellatus]